MINRPSISEQRIIDCLIENYGLDIGSLRILPWGADMNASVYKAQTKQQANYFVKLKMGHHDDLSATLTKLLHDAGIAQIIPPLSTLQSQPIQLLDENTLIVYPFIEGEDGFRCPLSDAQWITLGKALRQVHEIKIPQTIQNRIRKETYSPKWREVVRSLYQQIESGLQVDKVDEAAVKLLQYMREKKETIQQLVDHAEYLSQKLQQQIFTAILCHSDIHGGNVLLDKNNTLYIVDWDEPIMAPKERDLMFIGGGVANVWNKSHEKALFYQGYGKCEINNDLLAYYRHERIVEDIAIYGQDLLLTSAVSRDRTVIYQHFVDMFEPNGVVEIALKT